MRHGFTLLEVLVVMSIVALVAAFLVPSLGTSSGRGVDIASRQLAADIENARLQASAGRTRTRILLPANPSNFAATTGSPWPADIAMRGYVITTAKRTDTNWTQRGKWTRFPAGVALDFSNSVALPTPSPAPMPIDIGGSGTVSYNYSGPYIEFLSNGSASLDPAATAPVVMIADGFVDLTSKVFVPKNVNLHTALTIDPLSGSTSLK